jgi:hypothetical protein
VVLVFSAPPQVGAVRAGGGDPVDTEHGAIEIEMTGSVALGFGRRGGRVWRLGDQYVDALMQVVVDGALADGIADGQLPDSRAVQKPAQHQNRLLERPASRPRRSPSVISG